MAGLGCTPIMSCDQGRRATLGLQPATIRDWPSDIVTGLHCLCLAAASTPLSVTSLAVPRPGDLRSGIRENPVMLVTRSIGVPVPSLSAKSNQARRERMARIDLRANRGL